MRISSAAVNYEDHMGGTHRMGSTAYSRMHASETPDWGGLVFLTDRTLCLSIQPRDICI